MRSQIVIALCWAAVGAGTLVEAADAEQTPDVVQTGRYVTVPLGVSGHAADPMSTVVDIVFPAETVNSVGEALSYLLARTGWRWGDGLSSDPRLESMLLLPLPESQRAIGPDSVLNIVGTLCGEPWVTVIDPVHRLVSCELRREYERLIEAVR